MGNKTLQEFIEKNRPDAEILGEALNYLEKCLNANIITKETYEKQLILAEKLAMANASPFFIASSAIFKINQVSPEKRSEIEKIIGRDNYKIVIVLDYIDQYFNGQDQKRHRMFFWHSVNTSQLLSTMKVDAITIAASMLHHVDLENEIDDFDPMIKKELGNHALEILKKYRKINHLANKTKSFNNNIKELMLVMAQDVRVIFIKMASMLDSLGNDEKIALEDKYLLAKQAKEILAPIANMLGIWRVRWQLEDHAFRILQPKEYQKIADKFGKENKKIRDKYINKLKKAVQREAEKNNINCEVNGRFKHYYSIYQKMKTKQKTFNEIYDVFALRVIVNTVDECYLMMRIIHGLWPPVHKRIKDYIAAPKENGYQTLHTTVIGPGNRLTEFQIRTHDMHHQAQYGVAAHLFYKDGAAVENDWAKRLLRASSLFSQKNIWDEELSKIFQEKIYVYTPKGDIISLPQGATPVDFAYHIHSDLGHFCKFALVNNQPAELSRKLENEDVVEIIPDINSEGPDPAWLNFVKSNLAKKMITKYASTKDLL
ncbi:MAG: TGS domain-containing protein [Patescibacteria group bacterium]